MTKKNRSLLIGMILGDGCLYKFKNSSCVQLKIRHCDKQKDYLCFKAKLFEKATKRKVKVVYRRNSGFRSFEFTRSHKYLRILYKRIYKGGKKTFSRAILDQLDEQGLAIWYMDDGNLQIRKEKKSKKINGIRVRLFTYCSLAEAKIIQKYFLEKWKIAWKIYMHKHKFYLQCHTKEGKKFLNLINRHVIPSMKYKILIT